MKESYIVVEKRVIDVETRKNRERKLNDLRFSRVDQVDTEVSTLLGQHSLTPSRITVEPSSFRMELLWGYVRSLVSELPSRL